MDFLITSLVLIAFVSFFLFIAFTKKGKGWVLGGKVIRTLDEEIKQKTGIAPAIIRVHVVERKAESEPGVTIELTQNAKLCWGIVPIKLSRDEAQKLIKMLADATKG